MSIEVTAAAHTDVRTTSQACMLHKKHMPEPHVNHRHHVWPKGDGGPDIEDNIVVVCATGHYNVHDLLDHFKMHGGEPPYAVMRRYAYEERAYAKLGYERMTRGAM